MYIFAFVASIFMLLCGIISPTTCTALKQTAPQSASTPKLITGSEYLDTEEKYLLTWNLDEDQETIFFEVTVETKGYVGFGISPNGGMTGSDIFIAGVNQDGVYGKDYHGVGNRAPVEDTYQNWNVTFGEETDTQTKLKFHRLLNTCDDEDFTITDSTMRIIWAIGSDDNVDYHGANKGTKSVNFFSQGSDADFNPELYESYDITQEMEMPAQDTTYWCSIHKMPKFSQKQHIVAFEPILESETAIKHTHHFIFTRCEAPENEDPDEFFKKWVDHPGDFCYEGRTDPTFEFSKYCTTHLVYAWSKGGKRMLFPPDLGLPMPEKINQTEYYGMELHFDNADSTPGLKFKTGGRIFYTSELRDTEVGLTVVHQSTSPMLTIPPQAENFIVSGHCSSECTNSFLPEEGVTIFNNLLHAHLAARKLKVRHFRGDKELPWVDADDYYDFDFQQNKQLPQTRKLERGDHLVVECTYDSMNVEGKKAVIGGLSSHEEMCQTWFYYYPRQSQGLDNCFSGQDTDEHMKLLGVTEFEVRESDSSSGSAYFYITKPDELAGNYLDSISNKINWTDEFRETFQREKRFGEQIAGCLSGEQIHTGVTKYPDNVQEYVPPNECEDATSSPNPSSSTNPPPNTSSECNGCSGGKNIISSMGFINVTIFALCIANFFGNFFV